EIVVDWCNRMASPLLGYIAGLAHLEGMPLARKMNCSHFACFLTVENFKQRMLVGVSEVMHPFVVQTAKHDVAIAQNRHARRMTARRVAIEFSGITVCPIMDAVDREIILFRAIQVGSPIMLKGLAFMSIANRLNKS